MERNRAKLGMCMSMSLSISMIMMAMSMCSSFVAGFAPTKSVASSFSRQRREKPMPAAQQPLSQASKTRARASVNANVSLSLSSTQDSSSDLLEPGIKVIQRHNPALNEALSKLKNIAYFRYYSVDMLASCEYIPQELFECYSQTCEIYPVDEVDEETNEAVVPEMIRTLDVQEFGFDIDGWARWDMPSDDYYDVMEFQEEFTNYDGSEVWKFIHSRIAFQPDEITDGMSWKVDFNKVVSGMHSMISAHIIEGIQTKIDNDEEFDQDCLWTNPKVEYARRLGSNGETPQAMENMYFTYMLLLSAVQSVKDYVLAQNDFGCGVDDEECINSRALQNVLESPLLSLQEQDSDHLNVASNNLHEHAIRDEQSKHNLWEARMRSRELLRIMNCVQCNKCRLHGKIAAMGISTALHLLIGQTGKGMLDQQDLQKIHRVELAALMTTLGKFSNAIDFCMKMEEKIVNE